MDYSQTGSSVHGDSRGKNTGVGCHALLQEIFPTRDWTQVTHIVGRFFTVWATKETLSYFSTKLLILNYILKMKSCIGKRKEDLKEEKKKKDWVQTFTVFNDLLRQ